MVYFDPAFFDPSFFDTGEEVIAPQPAPTEVMGRYRARMADGLYQDRTVAGRYQLRSFAGHWRAVP